MTTRPWRPYPLDAYPKTSIQTPLQQHVRHRGEKSVRRGNKFDRRCRGGSVNETGSRSVARDYGNGRGSEHINIARDPV